MKAKVYVTLKPSVLDPQGKAIKHSVGLLGYEGIDDIRQGKYFEVALDGSLTEAKARGQRIEIARNIPPELPVVRADPEGLRTCFLNVAINAIQSTPSGGSLTVEAETGRNGAGEPTVSITFRDTGCGIAPADLERIFDPYFSTREAGVGLGLAITQRIVQDHGGEIKVDSAPGKGTTFRIDLPARGPQVGAESLSAA